MKQSHTTAIILLSLVVAAGIGYLVGGIVVAGVFVVLTPFTLVSIRAWVGAGSSLWNLVRLRAAKGSDLSGPGVTQLDGTARPHSETLSVPSIEDPVVSYHHEFQELKVTQDIDEGSSASWETVEEDTDSVPFVVETETERVLVDPTDAERSFLTETEEVASPESAPEDTATERHLVEALTVGRIVSVTGSAVRASESDIESGSLGYVVDDGWSPLPDSLPGIETVPFVVADASSGSTQVRYLVGVMKWVVIGSLAAAPVIPIGVAVPSFV